LGLTGYQNVVEATLANRKALKAHALQRFMIEDLGNNRTTIWADSDGNLYSVEDGEEVKQDTDFDQYLTEAQSADTTDDVDQGEALGETEALTTEVPATDDTDADAEVDALADETL